MGSNFEPKGTVLLLSSQRLLFFPVFARVRDAILGGREPGRLSLARCVCCFEGVATSPYRLGIAYVEGRPAGRKREIAWNERGR